MPGPVELREDLNELESRRGRLSKEIKHVFQFFWDKSRDEYS
jgi:hypothetical protein